MSFCAGPSLALAVVELGGEGLLLRLDGEGESGPLGVRGAPGTNEVGGVARFDRDEGNVDEKGDSGFPYWFRPDQSLPSTDTGDMAPRRPFISGLPQAASSPPVNEIHYSEIQGNNHR